jgi:hypothetical protein
MRLILDLDDKVLERLNVLGSPIEVLVTLADHAQQGVYRPASWERNWLAAVYPIEDWEHKVERDPENPYFERPKRSTDGGEGKE